MRKTREEKGITLIALIITIVVLLILAVVAINAVTGDGIIQYAKNAQTGYEEAQQEEIDMIDSYLSVLDGSSAISIKEAQGKVLSTTSTVKVVDGYGNIIKVPAGFMITADADNVIEGIVIEDVSAGSATKGSQFVWIPVGKVYKNTEKEYEIINLGRYVFDANGVIDTNLSKTEPTEQVKLSATSTYNFIEGLENEETLNMHAKNIVGFINSAKNNGGYYIGRYEAGDSSSIEARDGTYGSSTEGILVCKANQIVYNWITQSDASEKCQNMYTNKAYISDLVNSYAWDTAVVFIQTFGNKTYTRDVSTTPIQVLQNTGKSSDEQLNIFDMGSNALEFSTETSDFIKNGDEYPIVFRGYLNANGIQGYCSDGRHMCLEDASDTMYSFRPIIYM